MDVMKLGEMVVYVSTKNCYGLMILQIPTHSCKHYMMMKKFRNEIIIRNIDQCWLCPTIILTNYLDEGFNQIYPCMQTTRPSNTDDKDVHELFQIDNYKLMNICNQHV
jgi:hypothetical protein